MTKNVKISLCGTQADAGLGEKSATKTEASGLYYEKNGRCYLIYEEKEKESGQVIKTRAKFEEGCLEIIRSGAVNVRMLFEENKKNMTSYNTPFGSLLLGIYTKKVDIINQPDMISIGLDYELEADSRHLSDCHMDIKILST